ncbi:MAG TPA: alpha/beta fold hydrolase [Nevskiaceae bacterium]|nr:alpha/beta fold hydrolase [Nevskiaceae bacterium]
MAIVHPGHLCSREHPDTRVVATTLALSLGCTAITLDPRGTHDSRPKTGGAYDFDQVTEDLIDLSRLVAPPEGLILGGHCLGGAHALAAAAELVQKEGGPAPNILCAFTDKTMAESSDFAPLPNVIKRISSGRPLSQQNPTTGRVLLEPKVDVTPEKFEQYMRLGMIGTHIGLMPDTPVLLAASRDDRDIRYENVRRVAEDFHNAHFLEVPGRHSDIRPEIAQGTGRIIANWIVGLNSSIKKSVATV